MQPMRLLIVIGMARKQFQVSVLFSLMFTFRPLRRWYDYWLSLL